MLKNLLNYFRASTELDRRGLATKVRLSDLTCGTAIPPKYRW